MLTTADMFLTEKENIFIRKSVVQIPLSQIEQMYLSIEQQKNDLRRFYGEDDLDFFYIHNKRNCTCHVITGYQGLSVIQKMF